MIKISSFEHSTKEIVIWRKGPRTDRKMAQSLRPLELKVKVIRGMAWMTHRIVLRCKLDSCPPRCKHSAAQALFNLRIHLQSALFQKGTRWARNNTRTQTDKGCATLSRKIRTRGSASILRSPPSRMARLLGQWLRHLWTSNLVNLRRISGQHSTSAIRMGLSNRRKWISFIPVNGSKMKKRMQLSRKIIKTRLFRNHLRSVLLIWANRCWKLRT